MTPGPTLGYASRVTRPFALVGVLSLLLLGGAWLAARALTADVPVPPSPVVAERPVVVVPVAQPLAAPAPLPVAAPALVPLPEVAVAVVEPRPAFAPRAPPPPRPSLDDLDHPPPPAQPLDPSADVDTQLEAQRAAATEQAWQVLKSPRAGVASWQHAEKEFQRCLSQAPQDERCKAGLEAARRLIGPRPLAAPGPRPQPPDYADE